MRGGLELSLGSNEDAVAAEMNILPEKTHASKSSSLDVITWQYRFTIFPNLAGVKETIGCIICTEGCA
jgi:hypothetical protein